MSAAIISIIGTVTEVIYDKKSPYQTKCRLFLHEDRKEVNLCYLHSIPLREGDILKAFCLWQNDSYYAKALPAVKMFSQRGYYITSWQKLFARERKFSTEDFYDNFCLIANDQLDDYLNALVTEYYQSRDEEILRSLGKVSKKVKLIKRLFIWWYKERLQRSLRLLFWKTEDIHFFKLSLPEMRQLCLNNPFCCFFLSEEQCLEIMTMQEISTISKKAKALAYITRYLYQQISKRSWSCVSSKNIIQQFPYYNDFRQELFDDYFVTEDLDHVYLTPIYEKEKLCANVLSKLALKNKLPVTNEWLNPQNLTFPDVYSYDQRKSIIGALEHPVSIISGGAGVGKCLGINTPVIMYDGHVKMVQDLKVNDILMGPDNRPRKILSTTYGKDKLYFVKSKCCDTFVCNGEHILCLRDRDLHIRKNNNSKKLWIKYYRRGIAFREYVRTEEEAVKFIASIKFDNFTVRVKDFINWDKKRQKNVFIVYNYRVDFREAKTELERNMGLENFAKSLGESYRNGDKLHLVYLPDGLIRTSYFRRKTFVKYFLTASGSSYKLCLSTSLIREQLIFLLESVGYKVSDKSDPNFFTYQDKNFIPGYLEITLKEDLGSYYGFTLSGDGLFLLGDFTVTHNTTCIGAITNYLVEQKISHVVASFTGKAVARVKEAVHPGTVCMTLDLLIYRDIEFKHLIIDEASMVCTDLLGRFFERYSSFDKITFVGDVNQLPPINYGAIFHQLIKSKVFPTYYLTTNFRLYKSDFQDGILVNAHNMLVNPEFTFTETKNFLVMNRGLDDVKRILTVCYRDHVNLTDLMILSPYNKDLDDLNHLFSQIYNKKKINETNLSDKYKQSWHLGDRIMITENNETLRCFNGQIGYVAAVKKDLKIPYFTINLQEEQKNVYLEDTTYDEYTDDDKDKLTIKTVRKAYALTIDKSQGSEWDFVILYISKFSAGDFINKQRIYTAITRAKRACWIVTDDNRDMLECHARKKLNYRCDIFAQRFNHLPELSPVIIENPSPISDNINE